MSARIRRAPAYIALHKPYGVVSKFTDDAEEGHRTLAELVPVPNVYAVGRLDKDSEGLLILTDDGALQHRVSHPKFEHEKTYWAQVEGLPTEEALRSLRSGVRVQDYMAKPANARVLEPQPVVAPRDPPVRYRAQIPDCWVEITLTEGRNRQVRRMFASVGFPVLRLIRVAVSGVELGKLATGEWRYLTAGELLRLRG
ncbi:MAG: pseudouridine synthase [Acidobacteriota bacterium]